MQQNLNKKNANVAEIYTRSQMIEHGQTNVSKS